MTLVHKFRSRGSTTAVDWEGDCKPDFLISLGTKYFWMRKEGAGGAASPFGPPQPVNLPIIPVVGSEVAIEVMDATVTATSTSSYMSDYGDHCFFEPSYLEHGYAQGSLTQVESKR